MINFFAVNDGDYIKAVLDRNLAENISRVLYPNDNVRFFLLWIDFSSLSSSAFQVMDKVISFCQKSTAQFLEFSYSISVY